MLRSFTHYADFLTEQELIHLITSNKKNKDALSTHFAAFKQIAWHHYHLITNGSNKKYYSTRDYLILSKIKSKITPHFKYQHVHSLVTQLTATKHLLAAEHKVNLQTSDADECRASYTSHLREQLKATAPVSIEKDTQKIYQAITQKSAIVVSFSTKVIPLSFHKGTALKNAFEIIGTRAEVKKDLQYRYDRITSEIMMFSYLPVRDLQLFTLHPQLHPTYASLQFYNCIQPITFYGSSFLVLSPDYLRSSTFTFGDSLETITKDKFSQPGLLEFPHSIYQQFPDNLKKACETMAITGSFPSEFDFQYHEYQSHYIETQLHSAVQIHDPNHVKHIHCTFDEKMPWLTQIEKWISKGITVSIGANPFQSSEFAALYQQGKINDKLLSDTLENIQQAVLILAETRFENLSLTANKDCLRFNFKITENGTALHQAQAAHILYLLGMRKAFSKITPIQFGGLTDNNFHYDLPLTGTSQQLGKATDHDAYTYNFGSMSTLLSVFMKRLFSTYLVSLQNEEYFNTHQTPHPITGKGATEESNLANELYLGDGKKQYNINILCLHEHMLIETISSDLRIQYQVNNHILKLFPKCQRSNLFLLLPYRIAEILEIFQQSRTNYSASILADHKATGKVLLALRKNPWRTLPLGYSGPGGHHNNPYTSIDIRQENEFGKLQKNCKPEAMGESKEFPKISYWLFDYQALAETKADPYEFLPTSLDSFDIFELGNLSSKKIKQAAAAFGIEDYQTHFGCSLPLRPVDSLFKYLNHMQSAIQAALLNNNKDCVVTINQDFKPIKLIDHIFWIPSNNFGSISVRFPNKSDLTIYFCNLFNYKSSLDYQVNENELILRNVNPSELLNVIQTKLENKPLHTSAASGYKDLMNYFLTEHKMDINHKDKQSNTPLSIAASSGQTSSVLWLLERKASPDIKNSDNETPLMCAIRNRQIDCIIALYDHQVVTASLDKAFFDNVTPAHASRLIRCILSHEPEETITALLEKISASLLKLDDAIENILAVAKLWKKFREVTGKSSSEIIAIEQACGVLHKFRTLKHSGLFSFKNNACGNSYLRFFQPDYLTTPIRTIAKVMFPQYPDVGSTPCTRRIFWEDYLTEIEEKPQTKFSL